MLGIEGRERKSDIWSFEERIDNDTTPVVIYDGMVISDKDINFLGIPSDLWKELKNHNAECKREDGYHLIQDDNVFRDMSGKE